MCGIAGFSLSSADITMMRPANLAKHLALSIEHRGKDATGMSWVDADGQVWYSKQDVTATKFVHRGEHSRVDRDAATCIIHTRAATQGSPKNPDNNHPILTPNVVGVHNGIIWNDYELFRKHADDFTRIADVDSEIIFQLLSALGTAGLKALEGDAAISWLHLNDPDTLNLAALGGRPLAIGETVNGSVIFASEARCIEQTVARFSGVELLGVTEIPKGVHVTVRGGVIGEWSDVPVISIERRPVTTSVPKSTGVVTRQISDAEMRLAAINLFGEDATKDDDSFERASRWITDNVTDVDDLLWDDDVSIASEELWVYDDITGVYRPESEMLADEYDPYLAEYYAEPTGEFPLGDTRKQEAFTQSLNEVIVRQHLLGEVSF